MFTRVLVMDNSIVKSTIVQIYDSIMLWNPTLCDMK